MSEFKFEKNENGDLYGVQIGRIQLGDNIGRIVFCPDGQTRLFIESNAKADGSIVFLKDFGATVGFGGS